MTCAEGSRVHVVGESLIDIVHRRDGIVAEFPGGSPANVALTLGRLGRRPTLYTCLADDSRGAVLRTWLAESGVEVEATASERTSSAVATVHDDGSATYSFDITWDFDGSEADADFVHVGSIATLLAPGAQRVLEYLDIAASHALITYDPNVRPAIFPDHEFARTHAQAFVRRSAVVKASDDDLRWLYPATDPIRSAQNWIGMGPQLVVVTAGSAGATAVMADRVVAIAAQHATVVDTVGAGDTFMGALIDGLISVGVSGLGTSARVAELAAETVIAVLDQSVRAAAITVARAGANPPWRRTS